MRRILALAFVIFGLVSTASAISVVSIACSPDTVVGGNSSVGTITLDGAAPAGGLSVALTSSSGSALVPGTALIGAGQTSATFPVTTSSVKDQVLAIITATLNGAAKTGSLTINPVALATVASNPPVLLEGAVSVVTVSLNGPAPAGGLKVALSSSAKEAPVPSVLSFPAGQQSLTFNVQSKPVNDPVTATITASLGFVETTATLTVNPIGPAAVSLNPPSVNGKGQSIGTVNLYGAAAKEMTILLSGSSRIASYPASVKIPAGQSSATFPINTAPVSVTTPITVTAKCGGISKSTTLSVLAPSITTTVFTPTSLPGGGPATGTVTLSFGAPPGGMVIAISCDMPTLTFPDRVAIPAGKTTATFKIKTAPIAVTKPANFKTLVNNAGPTVPLTIQAPTIASYKLWPAGSKPADQTKAAPAATVPATTTSPPPPAAPTVVISPNTIEATITLGSAAPDDSIEIALTSSDKCAAPPPRVNIAGGRTSVTFKIKTYKVKASTPVTLTATLNGVATTALLTVN